jgi:Mn2+/Fe2+ NRAMP family transporter
VLIPRAPLVPILFLTQALNAILLLPLLAFIALLTRDRSVMGDHSVGRVGTLVTVTLAALIAAAILLLAGLSLF